MKEMVIRFEPFVFKQTAFIRTEEGQVIQEKIPQKELSSYISLHNDIEKIHFFGNYKFAEKIKQECISKYNLRNVEIVINK